MPEISPKAVVANPSAVAEDVVIGPFSFLGEDVTVESGARIAGNVTIVGRTRIGQGCMLFPGCVVGVSPRHRSDEAAGSCLIAAGNVIREHVTIEAGADPDGPGTRLGEENLLMVGCQVGHDAELAGKGIFANFTRVEHHCRIETFVRTYGFTDILAYATVGAYTLTTGYASIDRDAPPYAIVQGIPFRVRGMNSENLRRCGFDADTIAAIKDAFHALFNGGPDCPDPAALESVRQAARNEHVDYLVESLRSSGASPTGRRLQPPS
jgi:UDP-N-acetylglucosamine acyltransferase